MKGFDVTNSVFLVEDDPALRHQLTELINRGCNGQVVATAETEDEAITWLKRHPEDWHPRERVP